MKKETINRISGQVIIGIMGGITLGLTLAMIYEGFQKSAIITVSATILIISIITFFATSDGTGTLGD